MRKKKKTLSDRGLTTISLKKEHYRLVRDIASRNEDKLYKTIGVIIEEGVKKFA